MARNLTQEEFDELRARMSGKQDIPVIPTLRHPNSPLRPKRRPPSALPENQVEGQIVSFLRVRRWVVRRQHVGKHVPLGYLLRKMEYGPLTKPLIFQAVVDVGEKYQADWRAERSAGGGLMQVLYIEVKAPGCKPTAEQVHWLERVRLTGALAGWFDSIESFEAWYFNHVKDIR